MSWAARRRFIILLIVGAVVAAFLAILSIATFYKAPSCTDTAQNQDETGIDCGGSCPYLCTAQLEPPTVLFTAALTNSEGRIDVIALIENKNIGAAAKDVPYRISVFSADHALLQEVRGTVDLAPGAHVPVYVPGILITKQKVANAFLDIEAAAPTWFSLARDPRMLPLVSNTRQTGSDTAPRIEAILTNSSMTALRDVPAVVIVYDARGDVIAASQTVLPSVPPQGSATATFTWNAAFSTTTASIQVLPLIPLP